MIPSVSVPEGKSGKWSIEKFTIGQEERLSIFNLRLAMHGRSIPPGTYTRLLCEGRGVIMSDTPAERRDHYSFVRAARGHVLINGLGIGMCLNAALAKPEVTKATVVELDEDVIRLVAPHYLSDPRVEIVHADAYEYAPPKGIRYGAVWHDIWDSICADNLEDMKKLHRKYGRRADWQGSWARDICERYK